MGGACHEGYVRREADLEPQRHGNSPRSQAQHRVSTDVRMLPDKVFAVSEQVRQHCIEVDGIDPSRVQTIYNGLDLADWTNVLDPLSVRANL